jgi:hypothetical protein
LARYAAYKKYDVIEDIGERFVGGTLEHAVINRSSMIVQRELDTPVDYASAMVALGR